MGLDIIGDIHGCYKELLALITKLGYKSNGNRYSHPEGRKLGFVGDLMDRGPESLKVIALVYQLVMEDDIAIYVPGNHCNKLYRYFLGNNVQVKHGLETTIKEFNQLSTDDQEEIKTKFQTLYADAPLYYYNPSLNVVISHAGLTDDMIGRYDKKVTTFTRYGVKTGEVYPDGRPIRADWTPRHTGKTLIIYGHTPVLEPYENNRTINIDCGCVFGNKLVAVQIPEETFISVPSEQPFDSSRFTSF